MPRDLFETKRQSEDNWISISDLMAGLMMVFMFILILYAQSASSRLQEARNVAKKWQSSELAIYEALKEEFKEDLTDWNARIDKTALTIQFSDPNILFEKGESDLKLKFEEILNDFIPRYISLLASNFKEQIEEVRIEGHTSSEWEQAHDEITAFIKNMELSQARARTVLEYSLEMQEVQQHTPWMIKTVSANGMSSSRLVLNVEGNEDNQLSRRVNFKIKTRTQKALFDIMQKVDANAEI